MKLTSHLRYKLELSRLLLIFLTTLILSHCDSDLDDDLDSGSGSNTALYRMCTEISGQTLSTLCTSESCEAGETVNGTYDNFSTCSSDQDTVLDTWQSTGNFISGPNSNDSSGGSNTGGSNTGSEGSIDCNNAWSGVDDFQVISQCLAACSNANAGIQQGVDASCSILKNFAGSDLTPFCSVC